MVASTDTSRPRFVVGVDFGTTFTSVAFAHSTSPDEVKLVQTWPNGGIGNSSADQVPTELHYTNPLTRTKTWGYEVYKTVGSGTTSPEPLKWFKLLLQHQSTTSAPVARSSAVSNLRTLESSFNTMELVDTSVGSSSTDFTPPTFTPAQKTAQKLQQLGISPLNVVSDFLTSVREVAMASIQRTYDSDWVRESRVEYILTVPAIWTDSAKDLMVQAAVAAGFGEHRIDFDLVSEPESAAAYTLKAIQPNHLNRGDTFVICDAGGGTVDLISYKIQGLNPLRIDESVCGSGDLCGSVFLDERFESYIREILGEKAIDCMKPRSKIEMMRTWEEKVKFKFGNSTGRDCYEVSVHGVPDNDETNVEDGFHTMETEDVEKIFDPIVDRIVALVKQQVSDVERKGENVAAILLVGGFGSSEYLLKRLQTTRYGDKTLQVLQPMNARSAIARGALLRGLDGSIVKERRARRYYGCVSSTHYVNGNGWETQMYYCSKTEKWLVHDKLTWYIQKSMIVGDTVSISFPFCRYLANPIVPGRLKFQDELRACDLSDAPDFKWKNPNAVHRCCTVLSDLSDISHDRFIESTNSAGMKYYRVDYDLRLTLVSEVLKFELLFDGVICGSATAKFE